MHGMRGDGVRRFRKGKGIPGPTRWDSADDGDRGEYRSVNCGSQSAAQGWQTPDSAGMQGLFEMREMRLRNPVGKVLYKMRAGYVERDQTAHGGRKKTANKRRSKGNSGQADRGENALCG